DIFIFTELETKKIIDTILIPAAQKYLNMSPKECNQLYYIFGVDGKYGRHYSFLKAISAFWQVLIDDNIKGTFKIDLDQVFPQEELKNETGSFAFEHFKTPLWGAEGEDSEGNKLELGMIAGALVNENDIDTSLFVPDVPFPKKELTGDELIFFSHLPQAISTEAEMMTLYEDTASIDGKEACLQRIHVTGGTTGILINSLRKYHPFTPTFIGRAEDQAYILSVLFKDSEKNLRYLHKDGLIMRHDKEAFAGEAIKAAKIGKTIGDYTRILWFSYYVKALEWEFQKTKNTLDPFTGCFVSHIPFTIVYLRLALKAASLFTSKQEEKIKEGVRFLELGSKRLFEISQKLSSNSNPLLEEYEREKNAWKLYYDILDILEKKIIEHDPLALDLKQKAKSLIQEANI
ncbi:hypothetical protein ACFLQ1_01050, partial [Candidatus Auribacterota bacterium]